MSIKSFSSFVLESHSIMEGGSAIKTSRRIRESEVSKTLKSIEEKLFPLMGLSPDDIGNDFIYIGSIGKKKNPDDTSGDIDLGYDAKEFMLKNGLVFRDCSTKLYEILSEELPVIMGDDIEMNHLKGLNIVSVGWPIEGDFDKGVVQLDLIPIKNMNWAKFIYYSPDYRMDESKWKSAHRNWLLSAALVAQRKTLSTNDAGEVMDYETPVLVLPEGLFIQSKTFRGKLKSRLKNPTKIKDSEKFITDNPQEFIDFSLGEGYTENDVKTFEKVLDIMTSPNFKMKESLPEIKKKFIELCERTGLEIPAEINRLG